MSFNAFKLKLSVYCFGFTQRRKVAKSFRSIIYSHNHYRFRYFLTSKKNFVPLRLCVKILLLLPLFISAHPIQFQRDQINYIYHDERVNENRLEKFHNLFLKYYPKTFQELGAKTEYPLRIEIYTDAIRFRTNTGMASFTAAIFDSDSEGFYFLLTPKTLTENRLITIISHESCHASFHSRADGLNKIPRGLEEGFCYLHYPFGTILNRDVSSYCKLNFQELISTIGKNLLANDKKKREEVYLISSWFILFLENANSKERVIQILLDKNQREILEKSWQLFRKKCNLKHS